MNLLYQLQLHTRKGQRDPVNAFAAVHIAPGMLRNLRGSGLQINGAFTEITGA
ncbi:hypothetical protein D3C81_2076360 [compost metagenome]